MAEYSSLYRKLQNWRASSRSKEDAAEFLQLLNENTEELKAEMESEYFETVKLGHVAMRQADSVRLLEKIKAEIERRALVSGELIDLKPASAWHKRHRWQLAAAIMALLLGGIIYTLISPDRQSENTRVALASSTIVQPLMKVVSNEGTGYLQVRLVDGSIVMLGNKSSIEWDEHFTGGKRDIRLRGKARFKVNKDTRPFNVYANGTVTTALGTEFLVQELGKRKVYVNLLEGSVKVCMESPSASNKVVYLKPGEGLYVDLITNGFDLQQAAHINDVKLKRTSPVQQVDSLRESGSDLEFVQQPLKVLLVKLGERFDVEFKCDKNLDGNILVTGNFLPSDSIEYLITALESI